MKPYRHPESYRPPLAYGGHDWTLPMVAPVAPAWIVVAQCRCGWTVPLWALREGYWMTLAPRWCPLKVAAIEAAS